jgi:hypothetical protein
MKAVIAISGLAGFVLFGPPAVRFVTHKVTHETIRVEVHEVARVKAIEAIAASNQSSCRYEAERSFEMGVGSDTRLELSAGSGSLEVVGVEGLGEVRAVARACASHEEFLDDLQLTAEERGSALYVETHYPDQSNRSGWGERYARLDLRLEVPLGMAGEIRDGSGEAEISGMGDLWVADGSGELEINNILGSVEVQDGSGELTIGDIQGRVSIQDGSGEIELWSVGGDVEIQDGSGEMDLRDIRGNVVLSDSSGEIDVKDVEMSVRVRGDSSGDIIVDGVGGDFVVQGDGSGSIHHHNVAGTVDIPRRKRER